MGRGTSTRNSTSYTISAQPQTVRGSNGVQYQPQHFHHRKSHHHQQQQSQQQLPMAQLPTQQVRHFTPSLPHSVPPFSTTRPSATESHHLTTAQLHNGHTNGQSTDTDSGCGTATETSVTPATNSSANTTPTNSSSSTVSTQTQVHNQQHVQLMVEVAPVPPPAPKPPANPVYYYVKDILARQHSANGDNKSLREITAELWPQMSAEEVHFFEVNNPVSKAQREHDLHQLADFFGSDPTKPVCTVVSSNVFVHNPHTGLCIPAEIGLVHYSVGEGIIEECHSLIRPLEPVPEAESLAAHEQTKYHQLCPVNTELVYPQTKILLRTIHYFVHSNPSGSWVPRTSTAWVFIEDSEFDRTTAVLEWCRRTATQLGMRLKWNYTAIRLSSVWAALKQRVQEHTDPSSDRAAFTETRQFRNTFLCRAHCARKIANCAMSKAHIYCYVLAQKFTTAFGVPMINGRHYPFSLKHFVAQTQQQQQKA